MSISTTGKTTIAAGITGVLASLALLGFFGGSGILGAVGDLLDVLNSALIIPLFITLGGVTMPRGELAGRVIQISGTAGALVRMAGAFLILSSLMVFDNAVLLVNAGMGLIGIAMLTFLLANRRRLKLGTAYYVFSLVVGVAMAVNIFGVFLYDAYAPLLQGEASLADMNPLLLSLLIFAPIQILGYPIWLLWAGRLLLKAPVNFAPAPGVPSH
jgi:hypothetical protein